MVAQVVTQEVEHVYVVAPSGDQAGDPRLGGGTRAPVTVDSDGSLGASGLILAGSKFKRMQCCPRKAVFTLALRAVAPVHPSGQKIFWELHTKGRTFIRYWYEFGSGVHELQGLHWVMVCMVCIVCIM